MVAVLALALGGCSPGNGSHPPASAATPAAATKASTAPTPAGGTIKLAYVEWSSCLAATNVVAAVLEKAGFKVKTMSVTGAMLYEALANNDVDGMVCAWLPTTHKNYYAKTKDRLVNLGPNMSGTKIGLVVPDYVQINSIADLARPATAKQFDNRIVGIDPGAGEMGITEKAIKAYNLPERLLVGSGATMTAALASAIQQHEPIVVTGWTPHWMWARWKLKYLADPKGIFGQPENIDTLVRKGLQHDHPRAYAILDAFRWTPAAMGQVMVADNQRGSDPMANAQDWVNAHPQQVAAWLGR
ncbi:MAG: glycine betaine ABC transporter substrate-binding protein [Rhodanobacteraceae bacterium]|nr:MAG: glycine betaine ABC transporter substrate-binding protein [Rhodanobacteraceae bacterium]